MASWVDLTQPSAVPQAPESLLAAATGGLEAPAAAAGAARQDPLVTLLQNAARWSQRHHGLDPLLQRAKLVRDTSQPNALAQVAQVTTHGPRAGEGRQTVDLENGMRAHIYFTPEGKRQVQVFRP